MHTRNIGLALTLAAAACSAGAPPTGHVVAAILGTGGDGATYRLPPGTLVQIEIGAYSEIFSLDGETTSVSFDVPVGDAELTLFHPDGYGDYWPLAKVLAGGGTDTVHARLATPMPVAFTVPEDASVGVTIAFNVAGGVIVFAEGTVDVSVDVNDVPATGAELALYSELAVINADYVQDIALSDQLPAPGAPVELGFNGGVTGAWQRHSSTRLCAAANLGLSASANELGWIEFVTELNGGTQTVCIESRADGSAVLFIVASRAGAPTTDTFMGGGLPAEMAFDVALFFELEESPFDGNTLDLTALNGIAAGPSFANALVTDLATGAVLYRARADGDGELTFIPTE